MAITGIHTLFYSVEAEALRKTLADVFEWASVDAGDGWPIYTLPPAEMGVHPADRPAHEITLMCDDLEQTMGDLEAKGIEFTEPPRDQGYGIVTHMVLPGELKVMLYEPRHPTAI